MLTSDDIAKYFLVKAGEEDFITNMKLLKLVSYAQGYYLGLFNQPLFNDEIEAWEHGFVINDVYQEYKFWSERSIGLDSSSDEVLGRLSNSVQSFLDSIYDCFGQFTASKLREMNHEEDIWIKYYVPGQMRIKIPHEEAKQHFGGKLEVIKDYLKPQALISVEVGNDIDSFGGMNSMNFSPSLKALAKKAIVGAEARRSEDAVQWSTDMASQLTAYND
jgi:uncharacterized phage-associated protein